VKLEVIGHTLQGREIIALKVTKNAKSIADGARPDVLYMGTIHAREWIATEVTRRELHYFLENYGRNSQVTSVLDSRELWFMPVANPDEAVLSRRSLQQKRDIGGRRRGGAMIHDEGLEPRIVPLRAYEGRTDQHGATDRRKNREMFNCPYRMISLTIWPRSSVSRSLRPRCR